MCRITHKCAAEAVSLLGRESLPGAPLVSAASVGRCDVEAIVRLAEEALTDKAIEQLPAYRRNRCQSRQAWAAVIRNPGHLQVLLSCASSKLAVKASRFVPKRI